MTDRPSLPHRLLPFLLLPLLGGVPGCGESGDSEIITIEGTYALESIDGTALPLTVDGSTGATREVVAGQLVLRTDATCERATELRITEDSTVEERIEVDACLWSGDPDELRIVWDDDRIYLGILLGGQLTISGDQAVYVYTR